MLKAALSKEYKTFLDVLRCARKKQRLSQVEVSDRLGMGISQSDVSKIERGERRIDVVEFIAFAEAIGMTPQDIITDVTEQLRKKPRRRKKR